MKKSIIYFISIVFAVSTIGCSDLRFGDAFLEKAPGVDVTIDTIFSSKLYADRALVAAYSTLRVGFPIHNSAWPLGSTGLYDQGKRWDRACSQLDNDNLDAITHRCRIGWHCFHHSYRAFFPANLGGILVDGI